MVHATDRAFTISSASEGDSGIYEYVMTKHWTEYFYIYKIQYGATI